MLTAPQTPKAKSRTARLFSSLPFPFSRGTSEANEIPAVAGGVEEWVHVQSEHESSPDVELYDLYLAAGIRPPTPLLKSCARFEGPSPRLVPARGFAARQADNIAKAKYAAPRGVGLGLRNVRVCPVEPIGWKTWPEEESLKSSESESESDSDDEVDVGAVDDSEEEEEEWSLENVSWENMHNAIWATKEAQRKRVIAGIRARYVGWV